MSLEGSGDTPSPHPRRTLRADGLSYPIRSAWERNFKDVGRRDRDMHIRRKVGIAMVFAFLPVNAYLWSLVLEMAGISLSVNATIRAMTPLFVIGAILAVASGSDISDEEE